MTTAATAAATATATDWWEEDRFTAPRKGPVVVQFTTEVCALCPDATLKIDACMKTHDFEWHIDNAFTSTLADELDVTALPAILVFHSVDKFNVYQKLRGDDVTRVLRAESQPRLVLDADF